MKILVINCGSSSIKFGLFVQNKAYREVFSGQVEKIGEQTSRLILTNQDKPSDNRDTNISAKDHRQAFQAIFTVLKEMADTVGSGPDAIGHRVVHGGEYFQGPAKIDGNVIETIRALNPLAPLHNPVNLLGIEICLENFSNIPQIAIFDTAFHQTLPPKAYRYAIPEDWYKEHGIRRYGFHGTSHQYLSKIAATQLDLPLVKQKIITLHLGNGASVAAIKGGNSVETSMGFTPLEGLVMGTRSGDIDASAALEIAEADGFKAAHQGLLKQGGLKGLCGKNDLREIIGEAEEGDVNAQLALNVYSHRIQKYIGAYFAILGGLDALVFSGGVGENSDYIRAKVCTGLECLGIQIDKGLNAAKNQKEIFPIQAAGSPIQILVIKTNEELEIAMQTAALVGQLPVS